MRKALLTNEEVLTLHSEMISTGKKYSVLAAEKGLKAAMLYARFKKAGLNVIVGKRGRTKKEVTV